MNAETFMALYRELMEENPFAVRAVLKVLEIHFTEEVPTLAVTCEAQPRLLVNLGFVSRHCRTDAEVKAAICHEFLHVLLRHTEKFSSLTPAMHLALDAVINAVIHRTLGEEYSGLMSRLYAEEKGVGRLLRPPTQREWGPFGRLPRNSRDQVGKAWGALYRGLLVADDIRGLAEDTVGKKKRVLSGRLLGGHGAEGVLQTPRQEPLPDVLTEALNRSLSAMNGSGLFRSPRDRGVGAAAYEHAVSAAPVAVRRWRIETLAVLKRFLLPDPRARRDARAALDYSLPVLSTGDRRAALRAQWSPFLPEALWSTEELRCTGTAQVYLDVSGSMEPEMPHIVAVLARLGAQIRRPLWAFSDVVAKARIENGQLISETTGGTSMACVLKHVADTQPEAAVIVTDGYIERVDRRLVAAAKGTRLHALVTRNGSPQALRAAGIPYTQLSKVPT